MKFSCERCGKKYAAAENLAPGRVYKLKCKACGHLIVVRASAGAPVMPARSGVSVEVAGVAPALDAPEPPPGDTGYLDLFADLDSPDAEGPPANPDDPFLAAARTSLPDAYGGPGAPDPLASLRQEPPGAVGSAAQVPPPIPKIPVIPKPPPWKSGLLIALIGGGVAVLVGILAFVLLGAGK